jgi:TolA-binding protein
VGDTASTPLADLTARVDALEKSLASLTAASEQQGDRLRQAEEAIRVLQGQAPPPASTTIVPQGEATPEPAPAATAPDPDRGDAVAAVEMPATGDAIEDAYVYGYRLYNAKFYPEAQAKLKEFVAAHPRHKRASYAQNLLGRAYLDEGKPALASVAFYDNYQKMPKGERAAESLYWLGQSLVRLKKPADACKVYDEFDEIYAPTAGGQLIARVMQGRAEAKCAA